MSLKKTNDNKGSYRGAGAYSNDYCTFDRSLTEYPAREIYMKVEGVGDYETDRAFTGEVSRYDSNKQQWPRLRDRYRSKSDGPYSKRGEGFGGRKDGAGRQTDGDTVGGQQVSGGSDPFDY